MLLNLFYPPSFVVHSAKESCVLWLPTVTAILWCVLALPAPLRLLSWSRVLGYLLAALCAIHRVIEFCVVPLTKLFGYFRFTADFTGKTKPFVESFTSSTSLWLDNSSWIFPNRNSAMEALNPLFYRPSQLWSVSGLMVMISTKPLASLRFSANRAFQFIFRALLVKFTMLRMTWQKLQVFYSVVSFIPVFVMNHFSLKKRALQVFRHCEAMLKNITALHRIRVIWPTYLNVTKGCFVHSESVTWP